MELFANIATLISGFMDLILFCIAIYTFYLTFISKKISILTFSHSFNMWQSDTVSFWIKNKTLKSIIISKVDMIYDNKYRLPIGKYESPKVLDPFKSMEIEMEPYTSMEPITMYELSKMFIGKANIHLEIITDDNKTIYAKIKGCKYKPKKNAKVEQIYLCVSKFGETVLKDDYVYVLQYRIGENGNIETAFINNKGLISTDIFGFNAIPRESLSNKDVVKVFFEDACKKFNISMAIYDLKDLVWKKTNQ